MRTRGKKKLASGGMGGCNGICNYGKNQFPVARSRVSRVTRPTNEDQSFCRGAKF